MSNDAFIQGLVATAEPVAPRRLSMEVAVLLTVAAVQLVGASFYFGMDKVQMVMQQGGVAFFVKAALFGVLALAASAAALLSLNPETRKVTPAMAGVVAGAVIVGLIGLERSMGSDLATTIYPKWGVRCFFSILSLALPVTLLLSIFMMRGASTQPNTTAAMIGVAGGTWGAFTYAVQCPFVSVWYLGVWYLSAVLVVAVAARVVLPRVARW